jgi:hypothetical protein
MDILVSSFGSAPSVEPNDLSRFSPCISACFWIGLVIYLFLRKILTGVAKEIVKILTADHRSRGWDAAQTLQRKINEMNLAEKGGESEKH